MIDISTYRKPEHKIDTFFINRWSPRAMTGETIPEKDLLSLFEAGKWAPSSYNEQPWRFIYARKDSPHWETLFNLLGDFNKQWCKNAAVLVVAISKKTFTHNNTPNNTHSFDTGAAWENMALLGSLKGFVMHGMVGFDYEKAKKDLGIPDTFAIEMMFAVGKPGKKEDLPTALQEMEFPSGRKKVKEIANEGKFSF